MDTAQLKKFAQESRKQLMEAVSSKLDFVLAEDSLARRESRSAVVALEGLIKEIGKEQVIEKVAYTWFNRFCALSFMDVNRYSKIGVVSPAEGQTQPEILAEAKMGYIDNSVVSDAKNLSKIRDLLNGTMTSKDPQGETYRLLLVSYCNSFNALMPFMFERINDYTELLMPDDLLSTSSVLTKTVEILDADACKDVEVIGWLYQYYITELNEQVYDGNMSKKRISKELLPAATQLFTPKWAVQYMVENSVGKLWLESHPDERLQSQFKYYLESAEQEDEVKAQLEELKNKDLKPQDLKVLDPACGSGHILVTAFSVLFEIYKSQGWQENEIPEMILKNNLYGLDICDRAAQLAQFAVIMKAREYDRNIFNKVKDLNICSIKDTDWIDIWVEDELLQGVKNTDYAKEQIALLRNTFKDAKEYGSILEVKDIDFEFWNERLEYIRNLAQQKNNTPKIKGRLPYTLKQAKIMQQNYECVITNPPYLGASRMSSKLVEYISKRFPNEKTDFCSVFYKKSLTEFLAEDGYLSFIMTTSWMFLKNFEKLREFVINNYEFESIVDYGTELFEGKVGHNPIVAWVNKNSLPTKKLQAIRLVDFCYSRREEKKIEFFNKNNYYYANQKEFSCIPGSPIAYWASDRVREIFAINRPLSAVANPCVGLQTADNGRFIRFWSEVDISKIGFGFMNREQAKASKLKWFPYNKGGAYRKWYGNQEFVVNWENDGYEIRNNYDSNNKQLSRPQNTQTYYKESVSWSKISSSDLSMRYYNYGFIFDVAGCSMFNDDVNILKYILAFCNSKIVKNAIKSISPTLNYEVGQIASLPVSITKDKELFNSMLNIIEKNIAISKDDWDSFETSWDFEQHPLIRFKTNNNIKESFNAWKEYKEQQFNQLKANEEELNRLFIEIYGLQDEMTPEVADKDITVSLADEKREIKSLLSYAVGCMFGRYSLDKKWLIFAGGEFDSSKYKTFPADEDAVIPVLAEHMFSDDITSRFKNFLKTAFGTENFEENLEYVASVLGKKNTETADDTIRAYFMKDFYKDHIQMYQKRPIYWMFSSAKGNFNALVYMHRYNKDTASVILNNYLRNYRDEKLSAKIEQCKHIEASASSSQADKIKASKERETMEKIVTEVMEYERDILYPLATERKEIDLDDGVKVNYLKFGKALKDFGLKAKK